MQYSDLTAALGAYLATDTTEANFVVVLPRIIEQAELRCYRDIDFLATRVIYTTNLTVGVWTLPTPAGWIVGRTINLTLPSGGVVELLRRDDEFLVAAWPNRGSYVAGQAPKYWAERIISTGGVTTLSFAAAADQTYPLEMIYTAHPAPLASGNTPTWLSTYYPDLFFAAAMVAASGYQKNFGQQATDPQVAMSWEQAYQTAKESATAEEARRKGEAMFDALTPAPATTSTHGP